MAYIEERKGKFRACVRMAGYSVSKTFARRKDAVAWAKQEEYKIITQNEKEESDVLVSDLLDYHVQHALPLKKSYARELSIINIFRRYFPHLCRKKAKDFSRKDVVFWREQRLQRVSASAVNREWSVLSHVFSYAKRHRGLVLPDNPFHDVSKPAKNSSRTRRVSVEDLDLLRQAADYEALQTPANSKQWALWAFLFALETACRLGEICKLQAFDIQGNLIHLRDTKNGSDRFVPLSAEAKRLLDLVELPMPHSSNYLSQRFGVLSQFCADLNFHDSRHEALTRMAQKIQNPMTLAKISGHRDLKILLNVYYNPEGKDLEGLL